MSLLGSILSVFTAPIGWVNNFTGYSGGGSTESSGANGSASLGGNGFNPNTGVQPQSGPSKAPPKAPTAPPPKVAAPVVPAYQPPADVLSLINNEANYKVDEGPAYPVPLAHLPNPDPTSPVSEIPAKPGTPEPTVHIPMGKFSTDPESPAIVEKPPSSPDPLATPDEPTSPIEVTVTPPAAEIPSPPEDTTDTAIQPPVGDRADELPTPGDNSNQPPTGDKADELPPTQNTDGSGSSNGTDSTPFSPQTDLNQPTPPPFHFTSAVSDAGVVASSLMNKLFAMFKTNGTGLQASGGLSSLLNNGTYVGSVALLVVLQQLARIESGQQSGLDPRILEGLGQTNTPFSISQHASLLAGGTLSALIQKDPFAIAGPATILLTKDVVAFGQVLDTGNWQPFIDGLTATPYVDFANSVGLIAGGAAGSMYAKNLGAFISGITYVAGENSIAFIHDLLSQENTGTVDPSSPGADDLKQAADLIASIVPQIPGWNPDDTQSISLIPLLNPEDPGLGAVTPAPDLGTGTSPADTTDPTTPVAENPNDVFSHDVASTDPSSGSFNIGLDITGGNSGRTQPKIEDKPVAKTDDQPLVVTDDTVTLTGDQVLSNLGFKSDPQMSFVNADGTDNPLSQDGSILQFQAANTNAVSTSESDMSAFAANSDAIDLVGAVPTGQPETNQLTTSMFGSNTSDIMGSQMGVLPYTEHKVT